MVNFNQIRQVLGNQHKFLELIAVAFQKADSDVSGNLQPQEFESVLGQIAKDIGINQPTKEEIDAILVKYDQNKDRCISKDQFAKVVKQVLQNLSFRDK